MNYYDISIHLDLRIRLLLFRFTPRSTTPRNHTSEPQEYEPILVLLHTKPAESPYAFSKASISRFRSASSIWSSESSEHTPPIDSSFSEEQCAVYMAYALRLALFFISMLFSFQVKPLLSALFFRSVGIPFYLLLHKHKINPRKGICKAGYKKSSTTSARLPSDRSPMVILKTSNVLV